MISIFNICPKIDINVETTDDLVEKLKFFNPLMLSIAQSQLKKKYKMDIDGLGESIVIREKAPIEIKVVFER